MNKKITLFLIILVFVFGILNIVKADNFGSTPLQITGYDNLEGGEVAGKINKFYQTAIILGGIAAVIVIVIGGVMYSVSGAINKKNEGKEIIISAISGLVLLLLAFVILNTINPELVNLRDPAGVEGGVSSFDEDINETMNEYSCSNNPGVRECENGEVPEKGDDGGLSCCIYSPDACTQKVLQDCPKNGKVIFVGEGVEDGGNYYCTDNEYVPSCNNAGQPQCSHKMTGEININIDPKCDGDGIIGCEMENYKYKITCGENISYSETIKVPNCKTISSFRGCLDNWQNWEEIKIGKGGSYSVAPYYPKNGDPKKEGDINNPDDGVLCVPYAYKINIDQDNWEFADLKNLSTCQ